MAHHRHLDNIVILRDNIFTEREEGRWEGRMEGIEEGEKRKQQEIARNMKHLGIQNDIISTATGLSCEEIERL